MKLERAQEYVTTAVAIGCGMFAAYYVGTLSGHGRFGSIVGLMAVAAFVVLLLALKELIWLLIPFSIPFVGQVEELTGHPALRDLAVFACFAGVFALRAFKVIRRKPTYQAIDFWAIASVLYLLTVYVRNPVGGEALGSARVGGRPYLDVFTATLAFWTLARVALPVHLAKQTFLAVTSLSIGASFLTAMQIWFPPIAPYLVPLVGGGGDEADAELEGGRKFHLAGLGGSSTLALLSGYPPLSLLNPLNIGRFVAFWAATVFLLLAGFRSYMATLAFTFLIAAYLRGGWTRLLPLGLIGSLSLLLLILMQGTIIELPGQMQRSLSFLPGKWDPNVVYDASSSSDWRFDMWRRMLTTDRYIESKWLGDGFGMTAMQLQQNQSTAAQEGSEQQKENFMVAGIVHSGPVSAIRYVGYVGLFLYLCFIFAMAREAWLLAKRCNGTPFLPWALYICVPVIYQPFNFIVIFGSYNFDITRSLVAAGMLKMMRTSVEEYLASEAAPKLASRPELAPVSGGSALPAHMRF